MKRVNTETAIATYFHAKGKRLGLPIAGTFELTARCNFNCPMCYVHLTQEQVDAAGKELTAQQWLDIAREARDRGMIFALLTGGEPLVRKDFFEIYKGMKELGLVISVNSNGSMLRGEILEKFLEDPPARFPRAFFFFATGGAHSRAVTRPIASTVQRVGAWRCSASWHSRQSASRLDQFSVTFGSLMFSCVM